MVTRYTWDPEKARINLAKHGVSFEEAKEALMHPLARREPDPRSVGFEDRFRVVGWTRRGTLVVVIASAARPPRIISARRATKRERHAYEARP